MSEEKDLTLVENEYGVDQIDDLEGLEAVRKRPGMYIGSTSQKGVTHLVWEVADNSIDEFVAGFGKDVWFKVAKDSTVIVKDNGRGIPVGPHKKWKNPDGSPMDTLIGILTKLHAGGKFNQAGSGYKVSAGLHGVGTKAVNALSDKFVAIVRRDGKIYQQEFSRGKPLTNAPQVIGKMEPNEPTGTIISYHPDKEIFKITIEPNDKELQARMDELASLNSGIRIHYTNEITGAQKDYHYEDGIVGYVDRMVEGKDKLYDNVISIKGQYEISKDRIILVEIAFIHDDDEKPSETIKTFANNVNTHEGGFHLQGFRDGYRKVVNKWAQDASLAKENIEIKYLLDGIHAVVSVKVPEAEFEGQTKTKLGNEEAKTAVEAVIESGMNELLKRDTYKNIMEAIVVRAIRVKEAEEAARKARANSRKAGKVARMALPGKLADCATKTGYSELFLVEGDSAGGAAKQGRNREFQAILPLRGKVLNTEKAKFEDILKSEMIKNIIAALGAGFGDKFDIKKVRYDKIVIMTDADDDGSHIRTLLLTLFFRYMRQLIEEGYVYVAQPPLFKVLRGKKAIYLKDDAALREYRKKYVQVEVQRFKGLGEMNYTQLKETTMDPASRTLVRVTLSDIEQADETFNQLMGSNPQLRRDFIEANAHKVDLTFL